MTGASPEPDSMLWSASSQTKSWIKPEEKEISPIPFTKAILADSLSMRRVKSSRRFFWTASSIREHIQVSDKDLPMQTEGASKTLSLKRSRVFKESSSLFRPSSKASLDGIEVTATAVACGQEFLHEFWFQFPSSRAPIAFLIPGIIRLTPGGIK